MLATDPTVGRPVDLTAGLTAARVFRERVVPCGIAPLRKLETIVEQKLAAVRALEHCGTDRFRDEFEEVIRGVAAARPHRTSMVGESSPGEVRAILREAREGILGVAALPQVADRLAGAPREVRLDVASELLHGSVPDRIALVARWVWNPARGTGALTEFGIPSDGSYAAAQTRLGEIRLELAALGFPCDSFAGVDVVMALAYAARLQQATDARLRSGGLEALLPGAFPLATMILGVRRRVIDANR